MSEVRSTAIEITKLHNLKESVNFINNVCMCEYYVYLADLMTTPDFLCFCIR